MKTVKNLLDSFSDEQLGKTLFESIFSEREYNEKAEKRMKEFLNKLRKLELTNNNKNTVIFLNEQKDYYGEDEGFDVYAEDLEHFKKVKKEDFEFDECKAYATKRDSSLVTRFWKNNENYRGYSLSFIPWNEILNYNISDWALNEYGELKCLVEILNEMSFYGFEEENINKEKEKLLNAINDLNDSSKWIKWDGDFDIEPTKEELEEIERENIFTSMSCIYFYLKQIESVLKEA